MTLENFLLIGRAKPGELCVIAENLWTIVTFYIDPDYKCLDQLKESLRVSNVTGDDWGLIEIIDSEGYSQNVPCHYIFI